MSLISSFTKQVVAVRRRTGTDFYGQPTYDPPVGSPPRFVKCRLEPKKGVVRTSMGEDIDVDSYLLTEAEITLDDEVEGSSVRRVEPIVDKAGKIIGYEAYL